jgi:putative transcriptional regulator
MIAAEPETTKTMTTKKSSTVTPVKPLVSTSAVCGPASDYSAEHIKALRMRLQLTRNIFAACLNISESTLQKWEYGEKRPKGAALRLISLIDRKGIDVLF